MKSKKLFAILTIVAFMMTMIPMAAFAGGEVYSTSASTVSPSSVSMDVYSDSNDLAKITLTFKDGTGKALATGSVVEFYVKSDRDTEIGYVGAKELTSAAMATGDGQGVSTAVAAGGKVNVYIGSGISGSFKLSFYNLPALDDDARLIGSVNCSVSVGEGTVVLYAKNEDSPIGYDVDEAMGSAAANMSYDKDGGKPIVCAGDGIELKAVVEDGGIAIEDKEVTFQYKYEGGSWFTLGTDVTDDDGIATYYFEQTKAGTYQYRASIGSSSDDKSKVITIEIYPEYNYDDDAFVTKTIEPIKEDGAKIAQGESNSIDFYIKDRYGNLIKEFNEDNAYAVSFSAAPAGSKFDDLDWSVGGHADADVVDDVVADGKLRIKFKPDKVGTYTLKVRDANETRVSATLNLEAIDFEAASSLKFVLKNNAGETVTTLARVYQAATREYNEIDEVAGQLKVYAVSPEGAELLKESGVTIASPDSKVVVDNSEGSDFGKITIKKDAAGTYPLTVYYAADNIVATYDLVVVGSPKSLEVTPAVTGKTATVSFQYIDANGNKTFTNLDSEPFVVSVPSGVKATNFKNINKVGKGSFDLEATEYGKYNVTIITDKKKIAKTFEIEFVMPASEKPVIGAKSVTMFIGATGYVQDGAAKVTDVAPFIQNDRTFVAVRPIADAFGCEIGWNEATQTVTLSRADMTVTIVIGSNVITVVKDGVTTTVEADVPAFIKDGRTVLPFRAVGDAFGATVTYDAATQAVSYAQ